MSFGTEPFGTTPAGGMKDAILTAIRFYVAFIKRGKR